MRDLSKFLDEVNSLYKNSSGINFISNNASILKKRKHIYAEVKNLIVVKLDAIGDCILYSNSYKAIRKNFPNATITALVYSETKELMDRNPYINTVIYVDRKSLQSVKPYWENVIRKISQFKFDLLINPLYSRDYVSDELVRFINAKFKIGVSGDSSNIIDEIKAKTDENYSYLLKPDTSGTKFELYRNAEILALMGCESDPSALPECSFKKEDEETVKSFLNSTGLNSYAIIFPGGKGGKLSPKYWGSENFARLIDRIQEKENINVLVLAGPGDSEVCVEISSFCKTQPVILQGHFTIWQVAAFINNSLFYIGIDTSISHLAAALKKESVVLLGGGHFGRFFPYPGNSSVHSVYKKMECFGCNWKCSKNTNECLRLITPDEVLKPLESLLGKNKSAQFNIIKSNGSKPIIDILLPPGNRHSWHLKDGFLNEIRSKGMLNKVFYSDENNYKHIFDYLNKGGNSDFLIALGGDHHLYYLHNDKLKQEIWRKYKKPKVCYSYESTVDSIYGFYLNRALNASGVFSHILAADETDIDFWKAQKKEAVWFPQFVDEKVFRSTVPINKRKNKIFFKGKLWREYDLRKKFIMRLLDNKSCEMDTEFVPTTKLVELYNNYMFAVNPPGVFGGFNVRTFEALACGSILLQYKFKGKPLNNALFKHNEHLIYFDLDNPDKTLGDIKHLLSNSQAYLHIAKQGREEVLNHHTIEKRIESILQWIDSGKIPEYPQHPENDSKDVQQVKYNLHSEKRETISTAASSINPKVSAIVSVYNCEKYIEGCIKDLINQSLYKKGELEIVLVNSGSEENEEKIIKKYAEEYKNIVYLKTEERESIYSAWNRAVKVSKGRFITNANADDRHCENALEEMLARFEKDNSLDVVYSDCYKTFVENDTYNSNTNKHRINWVNFDSDLLLFGCYLGPQPMWKKSLHNKFGYFDSSLTVVGDYEFWLRISKQARFFHIPEPLGLYYYSDSSAEHRNKKITEDENFSVQKKYLYKFVKSVSDIDRIKNKLNAVRQAKDGENYFSAAIALLALREKGLEVEKKLFELSNNIKEFPLQKKIELAEQIEKSVLNDNLITDEKSILENLYLLLATAHLFEKQLNEAELYYRKAIDVNPDSSLANTGLAEIYFLMRNYSEAKIYFQKALQLEPDNVAAQKGLAKLPVSSLSSEKEQITMNENNNGLINIEEAFNEAFLLFKNTDYHNAINKVELLIKYIESNEEPDVNLKTALYNLKGFALLSLNNLIEAKACFETALKYDNHSEKACAGLGEVFFLSGKYEEAKTMYEWAVKYNDKDIYSVNGLAKVNKEFSLKENHNSLLSVESE